MESFIFGAIGAIVTLCIFFSGVYVGIRIKSELSERENAKAGINTGVNPTELTDAERKERERLMAEQEAFRQLTQYSPDMAYGVIGNGGM